MNKSRERAAADLAAWHAPPPRCPKSLLPLKQGTARSLSVHNRELKLFFLALANAQMWWTSIEIGVQQALRSWPAPDLALHHISRRSMQRGVTKSEKLGNCNG